MMLRLRCFSCRLRSSRNLIIHCRAFGKPRLVGQTEAHGHGRAQELRYIEGFRRYDFDSSLAPYNLQNLSKWQVIYCKFTCYGTE